MKQHFDIGGTLGGTDVPLGFARCKTKGHKRCTNLLKIDKATSPMRNHLMWCHKSDWIAIDKVEHPEKYVAAEDLKGRLAGPFDIDVANQLVAQWLAQYDRPLSMPSRDHILQDIVDYCLKAPSGTEWDLPLPDKVRKEMIRLEDSGVKVAADFVQELLRDGLRVAIAGDIWSDKNVALLGFVLYGISRDWEMVELLAVCTPFSQVRHNNGEIKAVANSQLQRIGLDEGLTTAFQTVSDNGSNITKALNDTNTQGQGLKCVDHTSKLSCDKYSQHPLVKPTTDRRHGTTRILRNGNASRNIEKCQTALGLPNHKVNLDVATRWNADHDQCNWYEQHQEAVVLHDVKYLKDSENYAHEAGEGYGFHKMQHGDFDIVKEERANMQYEADVSQIMQGSKYPTLSLVLPLKFEGIHRLHHETPTAVLDEELRPQTYNKEDFQPESRAARKTVHDDLFRRFKTELPEECKYVYAVATVCDPRNKSFKFNGADARLRTFAHEAATAEYKSEWMNKPIPGSTVSGNNSPSVVPETAATAVVATVAVDGGAVASRVQPSLKKRKVTLESLMPHQPAPVRDLPVDATTEMERYLADDEVPFNTDILLWWRDTGQHKYPHVALMARQYLACPATSAGVERLFSKCGRAYTCLAKSQQEGTLESKMFAGINVPRAKARAAHDSD